MEVRSKVVFLLVGMFFGLFLRAAEEGFQSFTNDAGNELEAELLEMTPEGDAVMIRLRNGAEMEAKLSAFSAADRKRINAWWAEVLARKELLQPRARLNISAKMNRKSRNNERYSGYLSQVDDKTRAFFPEIVIENEELDSYSDNEVRIVILAEDLRYDDQLLVVSASTHRTDILDRGKTYLEGDPFRLRQYEYDNTYSGYEYKYGYEYDGYIVVIRNSAGEVTHTRSSKSKYLSDMDVVMQCEAGEMYDRDFSRKLNIHPNSYFVQ